LSEPIGRAINRPPLGLIWFFAPPLLLAAAFLTSRAEEPQKLAFKSPPPDAGAVAVGTGAAVASGVITAATVSIAASQSAMAAVMGIGGAAVAHAGHGVPVLGSIMLLHFIGMFGLSRVVGHVADRVGRVQTIFTGLALLAAGGAVIGFISMAAFGIGLLLVGFGWSFRSSGPPSF
jgi:hypothetical protein